MQSKTSYALLNTLNEMPAVTAYPEGRVRLSKQQAHRITKQGAEMKCGLTHPDYLPPLRKERPGAGSRG